MRSQLLKIKCAKLLDEYAGSAIILLGRRLIRRKPPGKRSGKILFIKFWGIGSIILSEPALRWLREHYPDSEIDYLTLSGNADLFSIIPGIHRVWLLPFRDPVSLLAASFRLIRELRQQRYDLVFDAEFFANYSALIGCLSRPKRLAGFARDAAAKRLLLDICVPFQDKLHTSQQFLNLAQLGLASAGSPALPALLVSSEIKQAGSLGLRRSYIVMNVNASPLALERRWPRDNFVKLGRALLERFPSDLVLIGLAAEEEYVHPVERELASARVKNLTGKLSLVELASVLQGAALILTNDSGPMHLAAALRTPVVAFFGPETPERYGPLSEKSLVFYRGLWCSPCMSIENAKTVNCINNLECMKQIDVRTVVRDVINFIAAQGIISEKGAASEGVAASVSGVCGALKP